MSLAHRTPGRILVICCPALLAGPAAPEAPPPIAGPPPAPEPQPDAGELPVGPVFAQVVAAIEDFSPLVEVIAPGRCAISATAPARYFGGEQALLTKITNAITALGQTCQSAIADGLFAAQLAAQAAPPAPPQRPVPAPNPPAAATQITPPGAAIQATPPEPAARQRSGPAQKPSPQRSGPPVATAQAATSGVIVQAAPPAPEPHQRVAPPQPPAPPRPAPSETTAHAAISSAVVRAASPGPELPAVVQSAVLPGPADPAPPVRAARAGTRRATVQADPGGAARAASHPSPAGMIVPPGGTPAFLAAYPVSVLEVPELSSLLPRLGIWTLGDFARLPAAEAASRFGTAGAQAHRLARGLDPQPLIPRPPHTDLSVGQEFEPPAGLSEPVAFAAKALAEELHTGLAARGLTCVRLRVEVTFADGRENIRLWRHDGLLSGLAVAERVRWQLDTWQAAPAAASAGVPDGPAEGGIARLRLVPDQLVRDTGRQLALWGETVISTRVARAATRVQAMLGSSAVTRPLLAGGRDPAEQVTLIPFGDAGIPALPAGRPWPGHIPPPAPATVYDPPLPAEVTGEAAVPVEVTGRAAVSAPPAWLSANGGPWLAVTAWAGPWPVTERWWAAIAARRRARFQLVTEDGTAWLAAVQGGQWTLEACYDLLPAALPTPLA